MIWFAKRTWRIYCATALLIAIGILASGFLFIHSGLVAASILFLFMVGIACVSHAILVDRYLKWFWQGIKTPKDIQYILGKYIE